MSAYCTAILTLPMGKNTEKRADTVMMVLTIIIQDHHRSSTIVDCDGGLRATEHHKE